MLSYFKERGYTALRGVDISEEQLELARQVTPNVTRADALDFLEKTNERFGLVTAVDVIEHLQKDEVVRLLHGMHRVLSPGGRLVVQTPNGASPFSAEVRYGDFTHEICFTPRSLTNVLELAGFESVECRELGPVPVGALSLVRWAAWKPLRLGVKVVNLVETGGDGGGIYSRVFIAGARRGAS